MLAGLAWCQTCCTATGKPGYTLSFGLYVASSFPFLCLPACQLVSLLGRHVYGRYVQHIVLRRWATGQDESSHPDLQQCSQAALTLMHLLLGLLQRKCDSAVHRPKQSLPAKPAQINN